MSQCNYKKKKLYIYLDKIWHLLWECPKYLVGIRISWLVFLLLYDEFWRVQEPVPTFAEEEQRIRWIYPSYAQLSFICALMLPKAIRTQFSSMPRSLHVLYPAKYLLLLMRNSFQAPEPIIKSVTSWDNDLRLDSRPLQVQSGAYVLMFCSCKCRKDGKA